MEHVVDIRTWPIGALATVHVVIALLLACCVSTLRRGRVSLRWSALEFGVVVCVPAVGAVAVAVQALLELMLRPWSRRAPLLPDDDEESEGTPHVPGVDPEDEARRQTEVEPSMEVFRFGGSSTAESLIRRLARASTPEGLEALRSAVLSPDRNVRITARSIMARLEERAARRLRESSDAVDRAQAWTRLALLTSDGATEARYLGRAAEELRQMLDGRSDPRTALELGRVLLRSGDPAGARKAFTRCLRARPMDDEARAGRADASFRLRDLHAARRDVAVLDTLSRLKRGDGSAAPSPPAFLGPGREKRREIGAIRELCRAGNGKGS